MDNIKKYITISALGLAGGVMYTYPYIRYVFHNPLNDALGINDTQAGLLITVYGIMSVLLYVPGGIIADKLKAKKPILISMMFALILLTGFSYVLSLQLEGNITYIIALAVWILMPFASTFVFWTSLVKALSIAGGSDNSGKCFGLYFATASVFDSILAAICMLMYTKFNEEFNNGFLGVTLAVTLFMLLSIIVVAIFFKENNTKITKTEQPFKLKDTKLVLKNATVWIACITMTLVYIMFTLTTYMTPYMSAVCGLSDELSGTLTIIRCYVIMIFAGVISGVIADKIFHSTLKWYVWANLAMAISTAIFIVFGFSQTRSIFGIPNNTVLIAAISILPAIFSMMIYAVQFAILNDLNLPQKVAGTAAGLASMFVFSPDIWFNTLLGRILDTTTENPETGYLLIFGILVLVSILVVVLCMVLIKRTKDAKTTS